jgi:hypothetical protein
MVLNNSTRTGNFIDECQHPSIGSHLVVVCVADTANPPALLKGMNDGKTEMNQNVLKGESHKSTYEQLEFGKFKHFERADMHAHGSQGYSHTECVHS